jgi:hypothetical protein
VAARRTTGARSVLSAWRVSDIVFVCLSRKGNRREVEKTPRAVERIRRTALKRAERRGSECSWEPDRAICGWSTDRHRPPVTFVSFSGFTYCTQLGVGPPEGKL